LWVEHIALVSYRVRRAQITEAPAHVRFAAELIATLDSVERCTCGHMRMEHGPKCLMGGTGGNDPDLRCPCTAFAFMPTPA
jgi:hypothetical protein